MSGAPDSSSTPEASLFDLLKQGKSWGEALGLSIEDLNDVFMTGQSLFASGDFKNAQNFFELSVKLSPRNSKFCATLGAFYLHLERPEDAMVQLENALKLDPNCLPALVGRGEIHMAEGRTAEGIADFTKVLALDPDKKYPLTARAELIVNAHRTAPGGAPAKGLPTVAKPSAKKPPKS